MAASDPENKAQLLEETAKELGPEALSTVDFSTIEAGSLPKAAASFPDIPACITQDSVPMNLQGDPAAIMVGKDREIPRWDPGSVVKWTAFRKGYKSEADADFAAVQLKLAAEAWNQAGVGITFEYVEKAEDAAFVLCHGGAKGTVLASAYFPNSNDLNFVFVYSYAFVPDWRNSLWKVLTHELGHVLGLRHEFAMDQGRMFEGGAVQLGDRNEYSVMNYRREPPEIQASDIKATKEFYELPLGSHIAGTPIVDYTPM